MIRELRFGSCAAGLAAMLCMLPLFSTAAVAQKQSVAATASKETRTSKVETGESVFTGEIWDSIDAQRGSRDQMMKDHGLGTPLTATIYAVRYLKPPAKYVLYNPETKKIYQIDDQDRVESWATAKVNITGRLDEASDTIHVTGIISAEKP